MTLDAVVENAVMLLALCWLLAFTTRSWNRSGQRTAKLLAGLWFGSACNGCHRFQGYLFGKPMPAMELEEMVSATAHGVAHGRA